MTNDQATNALVATNALLSLLDRATAISTVLAKAQAEGRDVSDAELDVAVAQDDAAKANLDAAIAKARGGA